MEKLQLGLIVFACAAFAPRTLLSKHASPVVAEYFNTQLFIKYEFSSFYLQTSKFYNQTCCWKKVWMFMILLMLFITAYKNSSYSRSICKIFHFKQKKWLINGNL